MAARLLIVDDEPLIAFEVEDTLKRAGYDIAGLAGSVRQALALIEKDSDIDIAVVDANLNDEDAMPIISRLRDRQIPFVIISGYSQEQIGSWAADVPLIRKPLRYTELTAALETALGASSRSVEQ